jgi:hypothetical protein
MFELIEYLWHLPDDTQNQNDNINPNLLKQHRIKMKELAQEAYLNIENSSQPLFLKFFELSNKRCQLFAYRRSFIFRENKNSTR